MQDNKEVESFTQTYRKYADKALASRKFVSYVTPAMEFFGLMSGVYGIVNDDLKTVVGGGLLYFGAKVAGRTMPLIHRDWCFTHLEETLREEFKKNNQSSK